MYCIYCVTNKSNFKSYVGYTANIDYRWEQHQKDGERLYKKRTYAFQRALNKYKTKGFIWQVLETFATKKEALEAENFYISYFCTLAPNGYNLTKGGVAPSLSEESKNKIREKLKIVGSFVGKKGAAHPNFGRKLSDEAKQKLSKQNAEDFCSNKISKLEVLEIYEGYLAGKSVTTLSRQYKLGKTTIDNILNKKCWKQTTAHLPDITRQCGRVSKLSNTDKQEMFSYFQSRKHAASANKIYNELAKKYNMSNGGVRKIILQLLPFDA